NLVGKSGLVVVGGNFKVFHDGSRIASWENDGITDLFFSPLFLYPQKGEKRGEDNYDMRECAFH
ncbi:MAG: hypothetical protein ACKO03_00725, partial [Bacteroidota bacterium]